MIFKIDNWYFFNGLCYRIHAQKFLFENVRRVLNVLFVDAFVFYANHKTRPCTCVMVVSQKDQKTLRKSVSVASGRKKSFSDNISNECDYYKPNTNLSFKRGLNP